MNWIVLHLIDIECDAIIVTTAKSLLYLTIPETLTLLLNPTHITQRLQIDCADRQFLIQTTIGCRQMGLTGLKMFTDTVIPQIGIQVFICSAAGQQQLASTVEYKNLG